MASAYSTNGTPRPCRFFIRQCDEIDQLIAYMKRAEYCGKGFRKRRMPELIASLQAYQDYNIVSFNSAKDSAFKDLPEMKSKIVNRPQGFAARVSTSSISFCKDKGVAFSRHSFAGCRGFLRKAPATCFIVLLSKRPRFCRGDGRNSFA